MVTERFRRALPLPTPTDQADVSKQRASARRRYLRLVVIGAAAVAMMFVAIMGAIIWQLRQDALADGVTEIAKLNYVLAEQTERSLQSCDLVVAGIIESLTENGPLGAEQLRHAATS